MARIGGSIAAPALATIDRLPCLGEEEESWLGDMTNWAVPEHPRNQVDKAGFVLVDPAATEDQLEWALGVINNWRSAHSYPLLNFRINLRRKVSTIQPSALIAQRIKRLQSIKSKLQTRSTMQLSQMQDIGGCRAVMNSIKNVERLVQSYRKSSFAHLCKAERNYIDEPKPDGYRSHHLVYQYQSLPSQNERYNKLRVEVQIRTTMQHAWATAVEAVGIFTREALKSNIGSPDWLRLFALMSAEIATIEKTAPVPGVPNSEPARIAELKALAKKLRAVQTLNAYRATINWAGTAQERKNAKYFLVQYDYDQNNVFVTAYKGTQSELANAAYTEAESIIKSGSRNVVLVSVDSIHALERAYPNYFLDTEQFTNLLSRALEK
jgi:hypothetical protein